MKLLVTAIFILFSFPLICALPPLYQGAKEISAILTSEELDKYLSSGDVIMNINRTEHGYEIITNKHRLFVEIVYKPADHPGPAKFSLKFHQAEDRG